jgi:hypothetical protein
MSAPAAAAAGHQQAAADPAVVHAAPAAKGAHGRGDPLAVVKIEPAPLPALKVASPSEVTTAVDARLPKASSPRSSRSASTTGVVVESEDVDTSYSSGGSGSGAEAASIGGKEHPSSGTLLAHATSASVTEARSGGSSSSSAATSLPWCF